MHILVVNDDGPPSSQYSQYILPFVQTLQGAGHLVSVVIPDSSRSWIGKAHLIGDTLNASYINSYSFSVNGNGTDSRDVTTNGHGPAINGSKYAGKKSNLNSWVIVSGPPASCTQLGLYGNLFPDRGPVDLVVSGPNHGRNASTIYNLSSGTVGGAMEAATCGKRAIAFSFASKDPQPAEIIQAACRLSVKLIEHLYAHWPESVELYNVNVPMRADVEKRPVLYSSSLRNYWSKGSLFRELDSSEGEDEEDDKLGTSRNGSSGSSSPTESGGPANNRTRYFKWSPELSDIQRSVEASQPGTDAFTVMDGCTSVTPLIANFSHVPGFLGEIKL